jgi:hypothetical protein
MFGASPQIVPILLGLSASIATMTLTFDARAGESTRLSYLRGSGAEECPDERALRLAVAVRLGYDPFVPWSKTTIHAQVARDGANLRARIHLAGEDGRARGSRELVAPLGDCDKLVAAMSLAISIAIDPISANGSKDGENAVAPPKEDATPIEAQNEERAALVMTQVQQRRSVRADEGQAAAMASPSDRSAEGKPLRWYAGLGAVVATGTAPDFAAGVKAFGRLDADQASVGLEARYDLPASAAATQRGGTVRSRLLVFSLVPCVKLRALALCGLVSAGSLQGTGSGVPVPLTESALYLAAGGRAAFELPLAEPFSFRLHADLVRNLTPVTLAIGGEEVWRTPPLAGIAGLEAIARVW